LYFIKNKIVNAKKRNIPSDLIIVQNDAKIKEKIIAFFSYFKKNTREIVLSKIKRGSVIPNNELRTSLGSKINIDAPTNDNLLSKNFLQRKYTGITVKEDKLSDIIRCNCIYCNEFSKLTIENQNVKNIGQPLLIVVHVVGKCPRRTVSVAYEK